MPVAIDSEAKKELRQFFAAMIGADSQIPADGSWGPWQSETVGDDMNSAKKMLATVIAANLGGNVIVLPGQGDVIDNGYAMETRLRWHGDSMVPAVQIRVVEKANNN